MTNNGEKKSGGGVWAIFGKASAVLLLIFAGYKFLIEYGSQPQLVVRATISNFGLPEAILAQLDNITEVSTSYRLPISVVKGNPLDTVATVEIEHAIRTDFEHRFPFRGRMLRQEMGLVTFLLENKGQRPIENVSIPVEDPGLASVYGAYYLEIRDQDGKVTTPEIAHTISVGTIYPGRSARVRVWSDGPFQEFNFRDVHVSHSAGVVPVELTGGLFDQIKENAFIIVPLTVLGAVVALIVISSYISQRVARISKTQLAAAPTPPEPPVDSP